MPSVGEVAAPSLTVDPFDGTTAATMAVRAPGVAPVAVVVAAGDGGQTWTGPGFTWTVPGRWRLEWAVTGTGARQVVQEFDIAPADGVMPAGFTYATTAFLANYTGALAGDGAERALIAASAEIDRLTRSARWATDPDTELPTDPVVADALARATCELVGWWVETGNESGARALVTSASIAGVSLGFGGRGSAGKNPDVDRVGSKVITIIANAALLRQGPQVIDGGYALSTGPYAEY